MQNKRITITELAKELNTTPSTVSRALRGHECISLEMREKVKDLAVKRNYTVNRQASSLRSGSSMTLGVIVPRINRDFFGNCIAGIEDLATKAGYSTIIYQTHDLKEKEEKGMLSMIESNVAGILISTGFDPAKLAGYKEAKRLGIPVIFFDRATKENNQNKVVVDDKLGAYEGVKHLLEQGYKRIVHFAGPQHIKIYNDRKKGYLKALKKFNIPVDEKLIVEDSLNKEMGYEAILPFITGRKKADALFSASDYAALGAVIRIKEMGISIPDQMGIIGFSNEMFTSIIDPPMSTIDQHSKRIGGYAVQACLEAIKEDDPVFKNIVLSPTLIIRESSLKKPLRIIKK